MLKEKSSILVTCAKGHADVLKRELTELGYPIEQEKNLGVFTRGDLNDTIHLNFRLRTGLRVLYHLADFKAQTADDLYRHVKKLAWEDYIDPDGYISITSSVYNPNIRDFRFANVKCKDAIVDRMQDIYNRRPDSGPDRGKTVLFLYWWEDQASIYLDTSGEPLSKRGYRKIPGAAPMQECLAAAVILTTGWDKASHFINPMCGSGTLAIEAAMMAANRAPGLLRHNFGFMHLKSYDESQYQAVRSQCRAEITPITGRIIASDIQKQAINGASKNADTAGVLQNIEFDTCDFAETEVPEGGGVVVINPEYGMRLNETKALSAVYGRIGDFFKQDCKGYTGYIFTGNLDLAKRVGLKTKSRTVFYNGTIECRLLEYELYEGTKKVKYNP